MIRVLLRTSWLNFRRDTVALALTFILPIVFFTIFASIFGGMASGTSDAQPTVVLVADLDQTQTSGRLIESLGKQSSIRIRRENDAGELYTRDRIIELVRREAAPIGIIIPEGFESRFGNFQEDRAQIELIHNPADPMTRPMVEGMLQGVAMTSAPDLLMERGLGQLNLLGAPMTTQQQEAIEELRPFLRGERDWVELDPDADTPQTEVEAEAPAAETSGIEGLIAIQATAAQQPSSGGGTPNMVVYYAAGIGVMFLLFSMAGAGGVLIDEDVAGTLERLLSSNVTMSKLLLNYWLFFSIVGIVQMTIMFIWGELLWGIGLWVPARLVGFALLTVVTACAAAAFGLVLAALCRTRAQLGGMSTIIILIMSALGGSMVPRFVAPDFMEMTSRFTFNGWALDGYLDVFWRASPDSSISEMISSIIPELAVLVSMAAAFLIAARLIARRWETS